MDQVKISICRNEFEKLFKRTLFSYPFYDKTDEELIADSINKDKTNFEFGLFELGKRDIKTVPVRGEIVEMRYIPLINLNSNKNIEPIHIKLSSFLYPSFFIALFPDKTDTIQSSYNYQTFNNYSELYKSMEIHYGHKVLISTCWETITNLGGVTDCVNIIPITDDLKTADSIRYYFIKERKKFINEILNKPHKYFSSRPIYADIAKDVLGEYKDKLENELRRLNNCEIETYEENNYGDDSPSQYELDSDNFYAMTDGQEGEFRSQSSYDDDNSFY